MNGRQRRSFGKQGRLALYRIYRIDAYLRSNVFPNAPWLAEKLEVSRRTIERDLAHLRDLMNAPLAYSHERRGYYYAAEFALPRFTLTEGEIIALFLGSKVLSQYRGTPYESLIRDAFDKLCLALPDTHSLDFALVNETISFAVDPLRGDERRLLEVHHLLGQALRERRTVRMEYYTASRDAHTKRRVDPYHLRYHHGAWYLIGYCHHRREIRIFALDRITSLDLTASTFSPDPQFNLQTYLGDSLSLERGGELAEVQIWFDPHQARYIREREWHPSQSIAEHGDGSLTLTLRVRGLGEVKRWVMGVGSRAEVLAPEWFREEVAVDVRKMGEMYGWR